MIFARIKYFFAILALSLVSAQAYAMKLNFECNFSKGTYISWFMDRITTKPTEGIKYTVRVNNFDNKNRKALIQIANRSDQATYVYDDVGIHLIEFHESGSVLTTIFFNKEAINEPSFEAVMSRHLYVGVPVVAQDYGKCVVYK